MNLDILSSISIICPIAIGLIVYQRVLLPAKILVLFILCTGILEAISLYLYSMKWNNLFIFHLHTFIEFGAYSIIFSILIKSTVFRKLVSVVGVAFLVLSIFFICLVDSVTDFNSVQRHVESILISCYLMVYFFNNSKYSSERFEVSPFNIFSVGVGIYFFGNLLLFIFGNEILNPDNDYFWNIHGILNILLNVIFSIVLLKSIVVVRNNSELP